MESSVSTSLSKSNARDSTIMRSLPEVCVACEAIQTSLWNVKSGHSLRRCLRCGAIFAEPISVNVGANSELYDNYYDGANPYADPAATLSLERVARSFEPARHTNRWLDIGYGGGEMLEVAQSLGWSCYGVEISPQALESGRKRGWVVTSNCEEDYRFPKGGFDVVTMIEFMEHISSPHTFLRLAARLLRPGGVLYLTTPNAWSLNRWFLRSEWSIFSPPEHLTIWTPRALHLALAQAGFSCSMLRTEGFNPSEILERLKPRRASRPFVSRNDAGRALNVAFSGTRFRRRLKSGINGVLSAFKIGDCLKAKAVLIEKRCDEV